MFQAKRYFVSGPKYYAALFIEVYYNPMDEVHPSKWRTSFHLEWTLGNVKCTVNRNETLCGTSSNVRHICKHHIFFPTEIYATSSVIYTVRFIIPWPHKRILSKLLLVKRARNIFTYAKVFSSTIKLPFVSFENSYLSLPTRNNS